MDAKDKIMKSAAQLGVLLEIPAYVDPDQGFHNEKIIKWENGDSIKVTADYVEGAFIYQATLGQVDPKTSQLSYITGPIGTGNSLESIISSIDSYLELAAPNRVAPEPIAEPEVPSDLEEPSTVEVEVPTDEPVEPTPEEPVADVTVDIVDSDSTPEPEVPSEDDQVVNDYLDLYKEYQELLLDPDHDHDQVREMSKQLTGMEVKLREQGIRPGELLKG